MSLSETLATVNNERNEMFETLYSIGLKLGKGAIAQKLAAKRKADLMSQSKAHYKAMLEAGRKAEAIETGSATDGKDTTDNPNKECN